MGGEERMMTETNWQQGEYYSQKSNLTQKRRRQGLENIIERLILLFLINMLAHSGLYNVQCVAGAAKGQRRDRWLCAQHCALCVVRCALCVCVCRAAGGNQGRSWECSGIGARGKLAPIFLRDVFPARGEPVAGRTWNAGCISKRTTLLSFLPQNLCQ